MLFLLFQLGDARFALAVDQVAEVLPLVRINPMPLAPAGVAGVFECRGALVPVVDACEVLLGRPAARCLSTRIIVVRCADDNGSQRRIGLIAEKATEMWRHAPADFTDAGVAEGRPGYLGPVAMDAHGLVRQVSIDRLLPPSVRDALFKPAVEARWPSPDLQNC